jgi:hypothetical protein
MAVLRQDGRLVTKECGAVMRLPHEPGMGIADRAMRDVRALLPAEVHARVGSAGELALGGLAIDEELALGRKIVRRTRAVRGLLFAHNEQKVDAILT